MIVLLFLYLSSAKPITPMHEFNYNNSEIIKAVHSQFWIMPEIK